MLQTMGTWYSAAHSDAGQWGRWRNCSVMILSSRVLHPVFFDPSGRRGYVVSAAYWAVFTLLGVLVACLLATSIEDLHCRPCTFPVRSAPSHAKVGPAPFSANEPMLDPEHARTPVALRSHRRRAVRLFRQLGRQQLLLAQAQRRLARRGDRRVAARGDARPARSTRERSRQGGPGAQVGARQCARAEALSRWSTTTTPRASAGSGEATAAMLASKQARATFADELYRYVIQGGFSGLVLDFEELPADAHADYVYARARSSARDVAGVPGQAAGRRAGIGSRLRLCQSWRRPPTR